MAEYERTFTGDFDEVLRSIRFGIITGSASASFEDGTEFHAGDVRCATHVYERYNTAGSNRLSLTVTLVGRGDHPSLCAITSGGSQAIFWKINTLGKQALPDRFVEGWRRWRGGQGVEE
ncbi:DUF6054 family protein [Gordonia aurantiaca]|uniref:DUF6054 family protein n=1 Tax=Gordonia sp. B21 TaxID=3151852 RepID=UPI003265D9E6